MHDILARHVAAGETFASLGFQFRSGKYAVQRIVKETSNAAWEVLQPQHMPIPDDQYWRETARTLYEIFSVPNCVGSVDGKHCRLQCPPAARPLFHDCKGYHSVVRVAIGDDMCCFTLVDLGAYGRNSGNTVFSYSNMGRPFLSPFRCPTAQ